MLKLSILHRDWAVHETIIFISGDCCHRVVEKGAKKQGKTNFHFK